MEQPLAYDRYDPSSMDEFEIRVAEPDDFDDILDVCSVSLGWTNPDFDQALFRWKHETNPFGRSLIMLAVSDGRIVAVRPFMRWRFRRGDQTLSAARAVDTATHPDARGKGLFRTLTEVGIEALRSESVGFIFNTPNDQSRPGYLKMGWREAGRVSLGFRPRGLGSLPNLRGGRVPADKTSLPAAFGLEVRAGLANFTSAGDVAADRWSTDHDSETLRWRFDDGPVKYRWLPGPLGTAVIARSRRRGTAIELLVAATIGQADANARAAAVQVALDHSQADYCLCPAGYPGTIPVPRLGPLLTVREISSEPRPEQHRWEPGDLELF